MRCPLLLLSIASVACCSNNSLLSNRPTMDSATASTSGVTPPPLLPSTTDNNASLPNVLWQPWSQWVCNCTAGSMSRVRELSYQISTSQISPQDIDRQRFERVVCSYSQCKCQPGQCDRERVDCPEGEDYVCALLDLDYTTPEPRDQRFWEHISIGIIDIWHKLKKAFAARKALAKGKFKALPTAKESVGTRQGLDGS